MTAVARSAVRAVDAELAGWHPVALGGVIGRETLERACVSPGEVDEVIVGCADPVGACGADVARAVVLCARWPVEVGGHVIDRGETSGMAAVQAGIAAIRAAQAETVLVMGLGLCSAVPPGASAVGRSYGMPWAGVGERFADRGGLLPPPRLADRAAASASLGRRELDDATERSRLLRKDAGISSAIVAVAARPGIGAADVRAGRAVTADAIRDWGDAESLPAAFDSDGLLTAASFATPADAVAAVLLQASPRRATGGSPGRRAASESVSARDSSSGFDSSPVAASATSGDEPRKPTATAISMKAAASRPNDHRPALRAGDSLEAAATSPRGRLGELAVVIGTGRGAGDPFDPTGGVNAAVHRALAEAGVGIDEVEIAVSEQDAATLLVVSASLGVEPCRVNRTGGALATGHAGAAEELRLITDGLADRAEPETALLTISAGPTGSAAILWGAGDGRQSCG